MTPVPVVAEKNIRNVAEVDELGKPWTNLKNLCHDFS